jgi:predicted O-methyltransferase YrrM
VYSPIQLTRKYLNYYVRAANSKGHGMHSPFVFEFIEYVLNNRGCYQAPRIIEESRKRLKKDGVVLNIEDLGAGSRVSVSKTRRVRELAATAVKPRKFGQLFYRLVKHYQPSTIVELGTSLGVTTSYLAMANPSARVVTVEGSEPIYQQALKNFQDLGLKNIEAIRGNFDEVLPVVLSELESIDLAYIDGNHRYQPTMDYCHQLLSKVHNESILVFDDIYWSEEMEAAWNQIKAHPDVRCSVDLFFLGFVFFRKEFKEKRHFTVRY